MALARVRASAKAHDEKAGFVCRIDDGGAVHDQRTARQYRNASKAGRSVKRFSTRKELYADLGL